MASEKIDALQLDIDAKLNTENLDKLISKLGELGKALDSLKGKSVSVNIKETGDAANTSSKSVANLASSFVSLAAKITAAIVVLRKFTSVVSDGIAESMSYTENLNLFTVSLGEYSQNAAKYGDTVREALGIDPSGWIRTQGVFNTLIEGFGVGAEQAAYMSQNLTQLTYDIASFYNLSITDAEKKIQSAVAGELEPVRRLGYDLSQNALTAIAQNPEYYGRTTYAINEETGAIVGNTEALEDNTVRTVANFNELTQGEKVQLRYIALMTQVTEAQGDMARTLNDPANQMRIFKEQLTMTSRALGNAFIPALNQVMPYVTAFFQVIEEGLQRIASLLGYELPDMSDRMSVSDVAGGYEDIADDTGRAARNAKKIKDYMIGIDELNVLRPDDGTSGGSGSSNDTYALGSIFSTPGYDFLGSAIENRIKEAKAQLDGLIQDFEEHPLQVTGKVIWEGAGTIGEKFWEWYLGKTPEELAQEANDYFGGSIAGAFTYELAMNSPAANVGYDFWTWLLGKSDEELALEAEEKGITIGQAIHDSFVANNPFARKAGEQISIVEAAFGSGSTVETRAAEAGRTIGEQFTLEFSKKVLEIFSSNPILQEFYKIATGRDALADIEELDRKLNNTNTKKTYTKVFPTRDNAATIEAAKHGQTLGKAYADGLSKNKDYVEKVANDFYNSVYGGVTNQGNGVVGFYNASSNMSRRYADGIKGGTSNVGSAGKSLYNSGYNGATNYGKALADYYNVSSGASSNYAKGLVNGTTGVASAGQSLYASGYNGVSNYGNGGNEFSNLANSFANLFAGALSSNSALSGSYNSGYKLANEGTWGAYDLNSEFEYVGDMAGQGYIAGIRKNEYKAEYAGNTVASATLYRMKEVLGIASPSKEAYAVGKFFDEGFANAISDFTNLATDNASNMAELSLKAIRTTQGMFGGFSVPTNNNTGYGVGATNESAMMNMASTIYQAVASGISTLNLNGDDRDIKVIIDGKEVFKVVQKEQRDRGVAISNGAFSR